MLYKFLNIKHLRCYELYVCGFFVWFYTIGVFNYVVLRATRIGGADARSA
jgi:hypothetical protein